MYEEGVTPTWHEIHLWNPRITHTSFPLHLDDDEDDEDD